MLIIQCGTLKGYTLYPVRGGAGRSHTAPGTCNVHTSCLHPRAHDHTLLLHNSSKISMIHVVQLGYYVHTFSSSTHAIHTHANIYKHMYYCKMIHFIELKATELHVYMCSQRNWYMHVIRMYMYNVHVFVVSSLYNYNLHLHVHEQSST